jgi:hypothetical protein
MNRPSATSPLRRAGLAGWTFSSTPPEWTRGTASTRSLRFASNSRRAASAASSGVTSASLTPPPAVLFDRLADLLARFENDLTDLRHDLFTRAGPGHPAGRVYANMRREDPVTVETAADPSAFPATASSPSSHGSAPTCSWSRRPSDGDCAAATSATPQLAP